MKITKSKLKQIILEEIQSDPALLSAIDKLSDSIDNLDVSIDFLSSAFTGESAFSIGSGQRSRGRAYRPKMQRPAPEPVRESEEFRDQQKMNAAQDVAGQDRSFEAWIAVVFNKGVQIDDKSPNPYDAWMSGQSPEEYAGSLNERKLSKGEEKEKERVVKGMKKSKKDFKKRYGDDAESVMYATATKIAKDKK